jgi:phospholipid transport system transporter-binding protein
VDAAAAALQIGPGVSGELIAHGPLTFATARAARRAGLAALQGHPAATRIDCSQLTACDSAGLAVLLDWLGAAKLAGRGLRLSGLPDSALALARISEIQGLLERGV